MYYLFLYFCETFQSALGMDLAISQCKYRFLLNKKTNNRYMELIIENKSDGM